jgi:crotonobetainyl-CoA:carnitine CoA-transferase CaiB-like acyl-CoA transferase
MFYLRRQELLLKNLLTQSLEGIRVLDLSRVLAGPMAAQTLADLGADVIKVEHPSQLDETREWGPPYWQKHSAYFLSCNRGKKAITLDLKSASGRAILHDLLRASHVVIENFRTSSIASLGLLPKDLHAVNPKLVICSISGYGRTGPLSDLPGYDFVIQGMSGMMAMNGSKDSAPSKFGVAIADLITGQNVVIATLSGLRYVEKNGQGLHADIALSDCAVAAMANVVQSFLVTGKEPSRQGNEHMQIVPYQTFQASDAWIIVAVGNDRQWKNLCQAIDQQDLASDQRFRVNELRVKNRVELTTILAAIFIKKDASSWLATLQAAKIPSGPIQSFEELFASELAKEKNYRVSCTDSAGNKVDLLASPLVGTDIARQFPPLPGEHTDLILKDVVGYSAEKIAALRLQGAVK